METCENFAITFSNKELHLMENELCQSGFRRSQICSNENDWKLM